MILLVCTCAIPMVFMAIALIVYKKKFFLNETTVNEMILAVEARKAEEMSEEEQSEQASKQLLEDEMASGDLQTQEAIEENESIAAATDNTQDIENVVQ